MSNLDKINIYVPAKTGSVLKQDMQMFEIFKANDKSYNWNRFLSMLVKGYYDTYVQDNKEKREAVRAALQPVMLSKLVTESVISTIMDNVIQPASSKRGGRGSVHLSLKPTDQTEDLIQRIIYETDEPVSQVFRRMLLSYCKKPFSQRERIVFMENYTKLSRFCETQQPIYLSTVRDEDTIHEVVPYAVSFGPEEMFNYLMCQEENPMTHVPETKSYALRRIKGVNASDKTTILHRTVEERLLKMGKMGPQYAINDDDEICVRLNEKGLSLYNRMIYFGRPVYERIEEKSDGYYQYYKCSADQVFLYFKRFDPHTAEIVAPDSLRNRMKQFFTKGIEVYGET